MPRTVREALAESGPTFSFEFFPPKSEDEEVLLWKTIRELEPLRPSYVSVTYGAGGSTREHTIEITEQIATDTTLMPVAHLTAVGHSVAELRGIAGNLAAAGVINVLALRGDPPGDPEGEWVKHPEGLEYAAELVTLLRAHGDFCVGAAAFPNGHPRSPSVDSDTEQLVAKFRAGAEYAVTNMFFVVDDYLRLRDRVAATGCDAPIIAGLMPITNFGLIRRSEQLTGAPFPEQLGKRFAAVSHDPKSVRAMGIYETSKLAERLLEEGVPGIHFYTMNRSKATREVWANLALGARV
ncbi:5,10-methylenetetrahydrofolate reductase (NAD(P)) [Jatrophihabitans endophyticus]|uniref:Methylenetetrahydrofolate reductase n=1 Tax=Jatrophihabitans endophyticus TaxID=1206085 RepID=A0A1M5L8F6_9ACTN|nr:methylenetetrahydrofolate reductase [NAD(P)H] [Jatrophihabitans endophyticus]SHG60683.1 5,10-methylenetetrahydrofolate reductase (NAD(P)) [Jatrophihabitans endophyticus]